MYTYNVCICMFLYVFAKGCIFVSLSVCAGGEWGSVVGRRPWMLSRLQLGTAMVHAQCRKQQEQATYKLKTSTFTLASSSMSSRSMKWAINTCIMLACQSEQEVCVLFMEMSVIALDIFQTGVASIRWQKLFAETG